MNRAIQVRGLKKSYDSSIDLCGVAVVVYKYLPRMVQEKRQPLNVLRA